MNPLVLYPERRLILAPRLFGSVAYYAAMARYGHVYVDTNLRYDKRRKNVHRFDIVDTRGPVSLTIPLGKPQCQPSERPTWSHCPVSTHGEWWRTHLYTLESAYGRTPYFEFVIDRFSPLFVAPGSEGAPRTALDLAFRADSAVRSFLGFQNEVVWQAVHDVSEADDMRADDFLSPAMPQYTQIRQASLGFHHSLSILDLIFNLGPEAPIYLYRLNASQKSR